MTKIKICGLSRSEDIQGVNEVKPDFIGFVFAESKRRVSFEQAKELKALLEPNIPAVGVFVNENISVIEQLANDQVIDYVQLHGDEDNAYIAGLRQLISVPIIKAVRVKDKEDISSAQKFDCDHLLFDAWHDALYGGSGQAFDWELLQSGTTKPFFLAGGLNAGNVEEAVRSVTPFALDVSSGVETKGLKDFDKMREIVETVRSISHG